MCYCRAHKVSIIAIRTQMHGTNELKTAVIGYSKIAVTIEE